MSAFDRSMGAWLLAACVAACAGRSALVETLDERAGMTITRSREPLVFARTEPRYSRSARDYVYLGPVATNRQGVREHFLWVGVATTLDRGFIAPTAPAPRILYVTVNGEPIELPLRPLQELVRSTSTDRFYATPVPVQVELAARVTLQQLALIDATRPTSIAVGMDGETAPRAYARWDDKADFSAFMIDQARLAPSD
jgi:hypothetical protein